MPNSNIKNEISFSKNLLENFKKMYVEPNLLIGKLYVLTTSFTFNKFNNSNANNKITLQEGSIVFVSKIRIVESIDYFNMGPALIITVFYNKTNYHLFIFPNQISKSINTPSSIRHPITKDIFINFCTLFKSI